MARVQVGRFDHIRVKRTRTPGASTGDLFLSDSLRVVRRQNRVKLTPRCRLSTDRAEPSSPEATYSRAGRRACNSVRKHATERADSSRYFVSRTIEKTRMRCLFIRVQALTTLMSGRRNGVVTPVITDVGTYRGGLLAAKELQKHGRQGHTNHPHATPSLCAWRYFTAMFYSSALV